MGEVEVSLIVHPPSVAAKIDVHQTEQIMKKKTKQEIRDIHIKKCLILTRWLILPSF